MSGVLDWVKLKMKREAQRPSDPAPVLAETRFHGGDQVVYNGKLDDTNPHKGTLKIGKIYQVQSCAFTHIEVQSDNGDRAYYHHELFELYNGIGYPMQDLSKDYEDALAAQDAMEGMI